ncbi:hypothetical protein [[Scytonema hofmanni] UTEX B 1581]|uniref:hypothetical protein n=1 Tax=[Scytonema hofmanni] UTEX B 1581 TaxID=379535 RepID=UPI00049643D2|nr:hypothetical protein [[Scytonema hofmanni] UTEX B 1581]
MSRYRDNLKKVQYFAFFILAIFPDFSFKTDIYLRRGKGERGKVFLKRGTMEQGDKENSKFNTLPLVPLVPFPKRYLWQVN